MEEERGYAAGGCNSEARQKKMGEKEEEGVQAGGGAREGRRRCAGGWGAGKEEEDEERNGGREGGWRCRWRWVLQVERRMMVQDRLLCREEIGERAYLVGVVVLRAGEGGEDVEEEEEKK
ncbi:hypothetical protein MRB53_026826 [Persea americana]|uniref:Uncharacterized protein n=1 Tax=Persea americana TaxID=3435 RepID=A0ACC2LJG1_PERAE|nr:hypothetical protein MRB53_026826 [Persea americana]